MMTGFDMAWATDLHSPVSFGGGFGGGNSRPSRPSRPLNTVDRAIVAGGSTLAGTFGGRPGATAGAFVGSLLADNMRVSTLGGPDVPPFTSP